MHNAGLQQRFHSLAFQCLWVLLVVGGLSLALITTPNTAQAEEWLEKGQHRLTYQNQNHWVAQQDIAPLRTLLTEAKKSEARHFHVQLPEKNRELSLSRLFILRDVLERSLKRGVILEETQETSPENTITITPTFPETENLTPDQQFKVGVTTPLVNVAPLEDTPTAN